MKVSLVRVGERQRRHFYKGWGLLAKKCGWKSLLKSLNYYTIRKNHFNYDMIFYVTSIKIVYIYNVRKKKGKIKKKMFQSLWCWRRTSTAVGAVLFLISDTVIMFSYFYSKIRHDQVCKNNQKGKIK